MNTTIKSIEENVKDMLNVSIGLLRAGEESLQAGLKGLVQNFEELKTKGRNDDSPGAEKLREVLKTCVNKIESLTEQSHNNLDKLTLEAQKGFEQVLNQVRKTLGEEKYTELNIKMQKFYDLSQSRVKIIQKNTTDFINRVREDASKMLS